jgi:hypothetical protein
LKSETFQALYKKHRHILAAARKNMKRVMTQEQNSKKEVELKLHGVF